MLRFDEVMERIGPRPALIHAASIPGSFGDPKPYRVEEGIAIVDIYGPLSNELWSWGGTTYGEIQNQVKLAAADPEVKGILLNINSPGGQTDNAFETAALVGESTKQKPVWAVAGTMAYSAAYLIASQADRVYCSEITGGVGSIGVFCQHMDLSGMLEQAGIKVTLISAGKGKTDGNPYEPLSDAARADIQEEIDRLYGELVGSVAKGRSILPQDIVKLGARLFDGAARAMAAGLADGPGDLETAWVDMVAEVNKPKPAPAFLTSSVASATRSTVEVNMAESVAETPKVEAANINQLVAKAREEGFSAAGEIVELCAIAGTPAKAADFIVARKSVADVRTALMAARADEQAKSAINPAVQLGKQGQDIGEVASMGKAKPWREVLGMLGHRVKEGR
jgi:signal peptide peptidase SppA